MTAPAARCAAPHRAPIRLRNSVAAGLCCCCRGSCDAGTDPTCRDCNRLLNATDRLADLCNGCALPMVGVA